MIGLMVYDRSDANENRHQLSNYQNPVDRSQCHLQIQREHTEWLNHKQVRKDKELREEGQDGKSNEFVHLRWRKVKIRVGRK